MNRSASFLIGCLLGFSLTLPVSVTGSVSDTNHLKVMTFNIRYDNPSDGVFSWSNRKELVFDLIRDENPDIVGFQEVLESQANELEKALPGYSWYGVGREDGIHKGEFAPVFYRTDRFTSVSEETFWLSETPGIPGSMSWGTACTRICSLVRLQDHVTGTCLYIFNTHFDLLFSPYQRGIHCRSHL